MIARQGDTERSRRWFDCRSRPLPLGRSFAWRWLFLPILAAFILLVSGAVALAEPGTSGTTSTGGGTSSSTATSTPLQLSDQAQQQVTGLNAQAAAIKAEIEELDAELEQSTENYNQLEIKVQEINVRLNTLRRELAVAQADYDEHVEMLEERIRAVYKSGGRDQLLPMLFLAEDAGDLYKRVILISQLADQDAKLLDDLQEGKSVLAGILAHIDTQKREELSLRRSMAEERSLIQSRLTQRQEMLAGVDGEIQAILEEEQQRQAEEQEQLRESLQASGAGQYAGALPLNSDPIVNQFLETAFYYLGIPYVWAGDRPSTGFDCSGFTQYVFAQHGVSLPHYSGYQAQMGIPVNLPDIQPGDLLAFGFPVHHVGIYIGEGMFIHAPRTGDVIKISSLSERTNLAQIRRFQIQPRTGAPAIR